MAMMRTRTKSRGMCLCLLGIALALLVQPSTDFARGVPGLKDSILAKRHPLHAGVARRAGAAQEDNSGQDRRDLEEVVAEADRVLEDNGTVKETKAVLRRWSSTWVGVARAVKVLSSGKAQKIYPGKWTLSGKKDELQQKLREFVEEAKATKKGLEEDSHRAQVTSWHPGRGGVASRASPQQDSGAEDWLAKSREEVEAFGEEEVLSWSEAVLNEGKVRDELIQRTVTTLQQQGVTGKSLLELTLEQMMQDGILRGPAVLLTKKIQLLQEPQVELPRFNAANLSDFEDRFLNSRINNNIERPFEEREAVVKRVLEEIELIQSLETNKPTVLALYSPRGTGKTSLIRHLAKVSNFSESRRCGRLLVFDALTIPPTLLRKDPDLLVSAIILWHLCQIFDGYSVEAELLVNSAVDGLSKMGGQKSAFTELLSRFPQRMGMFSAGTVNVLQDRPSEEYTMLEVQEAPALAPLSLQAARRAMKGWRGTQYQEEEFNKIHLFSAGVPRLLEAAFQTRGELASTAQVALNAMSRKFKSSYRDAAPYFAEPKVALSLVLCSAVRWPAEGHQL
ncbi:unnamed protein product, partial [Effrenium voratum]